MMNEPRCSAARDSPEDPRWRLPKQNWRMTWYGPGTGGICVACEQPIADDDVEVECDLPAAERSGSIASATTCG